MSYFREIRNIPCLPSSIRSKSRNVTFLLQNSRYAFAYLRCSNTYFVSVYTKCVSNSCQHISYWVTQTHKLLHLTVILSRITLPARLFYSGYFSFVGQFPETKPANLEFAINSSAPAANLAASVRPYTKLWFSFRLIYKCLC